MLRLQSKKCVVVYSRFIVCLITLGQALKANRRSTGQRARRQRELATEITALNVHGEVDRGSIRSRGQRLHRKLEAAKRCLEDNPNCGMRSIYHCPHLTRCIRFNQHYQKQSIGVSQVTHSVVDGICRVIKNGCLEEMNISECRRLRRKLTLNAGNARRIHYSSLL
jgi:hypothetical protein